MTADEQAGLEHFRLITSLKSATEAIQANDPHRVIGEKPAWAIFWDWQRADGLSPSLEQIGITWEELERLAEQLFFDPDISPTNREDLPASNDFDDDGDWGDFWIDDEELFDPLGRYLI